MDSTPDSRDNCSLKTPPPPFYIPPFAFFKKKRITSTRKITIKSNRNDDVNQKSDGEIDAKREIDTGYGSTSEVIVKKKWRRKSKQSQKRKGKRERNYKWKNGKIVSDRYGKRCVHEKHEAKVLETT